MGEEWRDIPGYEGRYQVSNLGRVRSVARRVRCLDKLGVERQRAVAGCVLKPGMNRGYLIVNLWPKGTVAVHLLVARAWLPHESENVNHIDGVKTNNTLGNLEWCTRKYNQEHAVTAGLRKQAKRVAHPVTGEVFASITRAARAYRCRVSTVRAEWVIL